MVVLKQESRFAKANDQGLSHVRRRCSLHFLFQYPTKTLLFFFLISHTCVLLLQFSMQIEQGIPVVSKWLIFNRFKFVASKGVRLGPAFLLARYYWLNLDK